MRRIDDRAIVARPALTPSLSQRERGFTLTEMMVAVAVLVVVIIATSKIFGTASKVVGMGNGLGSVMQEGVAIEQQIRDDIAKLTSEGFFAIHCVAVANNVNAAAGGPLLNPNLPPTAIVRADQLLFFADGVSSLQTFRVTEGSRHRGQGTVARIYWGHAFQLREGQAANVTAPDIAYAHDPNPPVNSAFPLPPWYIGNVNMIRTKFKTIANTGGNTDIFEQSAGSPAVINGTQPSARQWLLVRHAAALVDDDATPANANSKVYYLENQTARSIFINNSAGLPWGWSRELRNGRVDGAASQLNDIRRWVTIGNPATGQLRPWDQPAYSGGDQRMVIKGAVYYCRAERKAPSMHRVDQALTNHVISSGCSSFIIDWTYDDGVGYAVDSAGNASNGVIINPGIEHPWFGLSDSYRGVDRYADWPGGAATIMPVNAFPNTIESATTAPPVGVQDYWAVFGYNQDRPLWNTAVTPNLATRHDGVPNALAAYTPFPSAIRITMTLHDPEGRLESGREFQFVVKLPRKVD